MHSHIDPSQQKSVYIPIVIVGAGIAGLNAALTLQDAGLSCQIFEASSRIGGRMHSDTTTWLDGMATDWCGEFIDGDHETILGLIQRFKLETASLGENMFDQSQSITYLFNRYYTSDELLQSFAEIYPLLQEQMHAIGFPTTHTHFTEEGYRLDHISVYDWIEQYIPGGHTSATGRLLDNACRGFYGLETRLQSSLNLVYMFAEREPDTRTNVVGSMEERRKIVGGNQRLPLAIAASLPAEAIHLNTELVAIRREHNDAVQLVFKTPEGSLEVRCDHVILTIPFSVLRQLDYQQAGFDALKQTAITQLGYGTISKLFLQFDTRYWYQEGPWKRENNGFIITDLNIQTLWDASLGQAGSTGILVDYTSGERGASYQPPAPYASTRDAEQIQHYALECVEQLERVLPGISKHYTGRAALSYPTGDPYLRGSYACWGVGQYTLFGGYEGVRQGLIHFAGEHCSVIFQGYMEGAAREGARAAQEILMDYSHP